MSSAYEAHDAQLASFIEEAASYTLGTDEATTAMKNLKLFSEVHVVAPEPEPTPDPVPETRFGKVMARVAAVWDNETTRVLIKSSGAFAGVALVAYSTIKRDHVLERTALAQANQRPN